MKRSDVMVPYDSDVIDLLTELKKISSELIGEAGIIVKEIIFYPDDHVNPEGMRVGIAFEQIGAAPSAWSEKLNELKSQQERMDQAKKQSAAGGSGT